MYPLTAVKAGQEQETPEQELREHLRGKDVEEGGLNLLTFTEWVKECEQQPSWRAKADRECDYYDGNQLDSDVMRMAAEKGLPPAIEPLIGPTIDAVLGMEAKTRTDWRVIPDSDKQNDEVAEALNYRLNQAERHSKADAACSGAYASQIKAGLGWVEVAREQDPFKYKYRCSEIHRNEIWFDWLGKPDQSDSRYLIRRKWMPRRQASLMFPAKAELINHSGSGWQQFDPGTMGLDGGVSTDLSNSWLDERGWTIEEQQWRDAYGKRVCLFEVWYRQWERVTVIVSPDGRVVEYDKMNLMHQQVIAAGAQVRECVIGKVRLAWFMGPHKLADLPSPYSHGKFPYVPFWGKREDRTGVPYGLIRGMIYLQDEVNARIARMQWGLAATRTTRTDGAVLDDDDTFREEVGRPDADIVLDAEAMRQGGVFKVERDFELNKQQYERLIDAREGLKRTTGISDAFMGQGAQSQSGVMQAGLVEQSNQNLADINDNFKESRQAVGDILLSLIIEDMGSNQESVFIDGQSLKDDKVVELNVPMVDPSTGIQYLDNDVQRTKLKVTLADVPSTPSFRTQQLNAMSEAFKSAPPDYQKVMMPHLFALMDVPNKQDIIKAIKDLDNNQQSEEQIQQRIDQAVAEALTKAMVDLKAREIEQKQPLIDAQVKKTLAESVNKGVEGQFGAIQTAQTITAIPQTAPLADMLLRSVGFEDQDGGTIMPNAPAPVAGAMPAQEGQPAELDPMQVEAIQRQQPRTAREVLGRRNTSPQFPANPAMPANPDVGVNAGIEGGQ